MHPPLLDPKISFVHQTLEQEHESQPFCHLEEGIIQGWKSDHRRDQFRLGRLAAHKAISHIDPALNGPILKGDHGEPLWPKGLIGSIAHTETHAVAAVSREEDLLSLGIDLELATRSVDSIKDLILLQSESTWLEKVHYPYPLVTLFSAKEAAFKALYPLVKRYLDFQEIELFYNVENDQLRGAFKVSPDQFRQRDGEFIVGLHLCNDLVITWVAL